MTPSLLDAFHYYKNTPWGSREDFIRTLSRVRSVPTEAMARGIKFEDDVHDYCGEAFEFCDFEKEELTEKEQKKIKLYNECVINIGDICKGGIWQPPVKKVIHINGWDFLLYGRCDVIKGDVVYEIKTTGKYDIGKYYPSAQYRIYLYCTGLTGLTYLITDCKQCWREDYFNNDNLEKEIIALIYNFIQYLGYDEEASRLFFDKWISY